MERKVNGWVNFPIHSSEWIDSGEGGMIVKMVAFEKEKVKNTFCKCSGGHVYDFLGEVFIADDKLEFPKCNGDKKQECTDHYRYHYPKYDEFNQSVWKQNLSRSYLAAVIIGTTNWSGYKENGDYWFCTFNDLTEKGKEFYRMMQTIYKNADIRILTFLDT